jgi:hypothetical protein
MALPIKQTPVLKGKDASKFSEQLVRSENQTVSKEDYLRAEKVYKQMKQNKQSCF